MRTKSNLANKNLIKKALTAIPSFNLQTFNFFDTELKAQLESSFDKKQIKTLRTLQRLIKLLPKEHHLEQAEKQQLEQSTTKKTVKAALTKAEQIALNLYNAGLHSAYQIASLSEMELMEKYADAFSEEHRDIMEELYKNAKAVKHKTMLDHLAIVQHNDPHYTSSRFNNLKGATDKVFSTLPNYEELFGGLNFCTCPDCRSILSPAAYFFDLLRIVNNKNYITYATTVPAPKALTERRPDLEQIELNCDNTNTLVSKLEIVNKVLLNALGNNPATGSPYQYSDFLNIQYPFNLPANFPLTQVRTYLAQNNTSLPEIWQTLVNGPVDAQQLNLEILQIIPEAWAMYTKAVTDTTALAKLYGVSNITALNDTETFLTKTGLDYDSLNALLFQDLSNDEIQTGKLYSRFFVNNGLTLPATYTGTKVDTLLGLFTADNFDRANRFIRLAKNLGWSFADLDWALTTINNALNQPVAINDSVLPYLAWMKTLQDKANLSINQLCGFIGSLKIYGKASGQSFFEQVFSGSGVPSFDSWSFDTGVTWTVPVINGSTSTITKGLKATADNQNQQIQSVLAAALKMPNIDLLVAANSLTQAYNTNQNLVLGSSGPGLINLGLLYRFSLLATITELSLSECRIAYTFKPINNASASTPEDLLLQTLATAQIRDLKNIITNLTSVKDWLDKNQLSTGLVQYWLNGYSNSPTIQNQVLGTNAITNAVNQLWSELQNALFTSSVFSQNIQTLFDSLEDVHGALEDIWNIISNLTVDGQTAINSTGIIIAVPTVSMIENAIASITTSTDLATLIYNTISHYYELQQTTYYTALNNLYGIDPSTLKTLTAWSGLSIMDFVPEALTKSAKDVQSLADKLRKIQCYGSWTTTAQLSVNELTTFDSNSSFIDSNPALVNLAEELEEIGLTASIDNIVVQADDNTLPIKFYLDTVNSAYTMSFWVSLTEAPLGVNLFVQANGDNVTGNGSFKLKAYTETTSPAGTARITVNDIEVGYDMNLNQSYHMAFAVSGEQAKLYINGQPVQATFTRLAPSLNLRVGHGMGYWNSSEKYTFPGSMKQIIYFTNVLSDADIQKLYNKFKPAIQARAKTAKLKDTADSGALQQLSFDTLQKLYDFKNLVKQYSDSQNNFLDYIANSSGTDLSSAAQILLKMTNWDENQLLWLLQLLSKNAVNLFSIEGLQMINNYHDLMERTKLNCSDLFVLSNIVLKAQDSITTLQNLANQLWAGLQAQYKDDPDTLTTIQNTLNNKQRDILLPLVIYTLSNNPNLAAYNIQTARDVSEYLLTDVEVDAIVESSYIVEAISAVQLFIYRGRSNLEPGVKVGNQLNEWWDWLSSYRVWQANREVFLYPENYIEPSLRKDKTTIFTDLENALKQLDSSSDDADVQDVVKTYLDSLAQLAGIQIVGSAINNKDDVQGNDIGVKKELIVIGVTTQPHQKYYYLTASFKYSSVDNIWTPVDWSEWLAINISMQPAGAVTPIAIKNNWYITWVEQKQGGSTATSSGSGDNLYSASIYYSYLDLRNEWVVSQQVADSTITQTAKDTPFAMNTVTSCRAFTDYARNTADNTALDYSTRVGYNVINPVPTNIYSYADNDTLPLTNFRLDGPDVSYTIAFNVSISDISQPLTLFSQSGFANGAGGSFNASISLAGTATGALYVNDLVNANTTMQANQLYRVVFVCSAGKGTLYVDGKSVASNVTRAGTSSVSALRVGYGQRGTDTPDYSKKCNFPGYITQIMYFKDTALTTQQVSALSTMMSSYTIKQVKRNFANLPAVMPANNIVQYANDDTLPIISKLVDPTKYTVSFYCSLTSLASEIILFTQAYSTTSTTPLMVKIGTDGYFYISNVKAPQQTSPLQINQIFHVAFSVNTSTCSLYLNGAPVMTTTITAADGAIAIGSGAAGIFPGYITQIAYFVVPLSDSQVLALENFNLASLKSNISKHVPIVSNWKSISFDPYIISNNGVSYLTLPYGNANFKLQCIRLTSSAVETLSDTVKDSGLGALFSISSQLAKEDSLSLALTYFAPYTVGSTWTTVKTFGLKVFGDKLVTVGNVGTSTNMWVASTSTPGVESSWLGNTYPTTWTTNNAPALEVFNSKLYLGFVGTDNHIDLSSTTDVNNWPTTTPVVINPGITTTMPFVMKAFNSKLYIAYHSSTNNAIWYASSATPDTASSWGLVTFPTTWLTTVSPSLEVFGTKLYLGFVDTNSIISIVSTSDGTSWSTAPLYKLNSTYKTNKAIALKVFGNRLVIAFTSSADNSIVLLSSTTPDVAASWQPMNLPCNWTTSNTPTLEVFNNALYLGFTGADSHIYMSSTSSTSTGDIWAGSKQLPSQTIDFFNGPMARYYWELFFHIPFLMARELQIQQQFEEARGWFEYIFNPTINSDNASLVTGEDENDKYWCFVGLRSQYNPTLKQELSEAWSKEFTDDTQNEDQLKAYHDDPFDPNALAALRPIAYQKTLLMHYIDNLIEWADYLYGQYTTEKVNEATMLYIEAYDLLGKKPINLGTCQMPQDMSFTDIKAIIGTDIPEFIIDLEQNQRVPSHLLASINPVNELPHVYFGLPQNSQFIGYWDLVSDRLYKIRHALTIDGIFQQLALFDPALDPMSLIQQVAAGTSLSQLLQELQTAAPYYRFKSLVARAKEITQTVIQFGGSLMAALEKKDGEQLARLNNTNQQSLLALNQTAKANQLSNATESLNALYNSLASAQIKLDYYSMLLQDGLSTNESLALKLSTIASKMHLSVQSARTYVALQHLLPNIWGFAAGGMSFGEAAGESIQAIEGIASAMNMSSGVLSTRATFERRAQEWSLQKSLGQQEVDQIQHQLLAAQYQRAAAQNEITILQETLKQEQKIEQFLLSKFSSQELYQWLSGKLSSMYFQVYQLAYKTAKQAEAAWEFEKAITLTQPMIRSGQWNNLYQGLLAGEALLLDIQQMEQAYINQDKRRLEVQKTVSLAGLASDPNASTLNKQAFNLLQTTGMCSFELTQVMFDQDYLGHHSRQIQSITLSFPALIGPYQNLRAVLQQTQTVIYDAKGKAMNPPANQQVVLSQGMNDAGLITMNANDERYLPFEGTGAVSTWSLQLLNFAQLSLSDVIVQINYTALPGGIPPSAP